MLTAKLRFLSAVSMLTLLSQGLGTAGFAAGETMPGGLLGVEPEGAERCEGESGSAGNPSAAAGESKGEESQIKPFSFDDEGCEVFGLAHAPAHAGLVGQGFRTSGGPISIELGSSLPENLGPSRPVRARVAETIDTNRNAPFDGDDDAADTLTVTGAITMSGAVNFDGGKDALIVSGGATVSGDVSFAGDSEAVSVFPALELPNDKITLTNGTIGGDVTLPFYEAAVDADKYTVHLEITGYGTISGSLEGETSATADNTGNVIYVKADGGSLTLSKIELGTSRGVSGDNSVSENYANTVLVQGTDGNPSAEHVSLSLTDSTEASYNYVALCAADLFGILSTAPDNAPDASGEVHGESVDLTTCAPQGNTPAQQTDKTFHVTLDALGSGSGSNTFDGVLIDSRSTGGQSALTVKGEVTIVGFAGFARSQSYSSYTTYLNNLRLGKDGSAGDSLVIHGRKKTNSDEKAGRLLNNSAFDSGGAIVMRDPVVSGPGSVTRGTLFELDVQTNGTAAADFLDFKNTVDFNPAESAGPSAVPASSTVPTVLLAPIASNTAATDGSEVDIVKAHMDAGVTGVRVLGSFENLGSLLQMNGEWWSLTQATDSATSVTTYSMTLLGNDEIDVTSAGQTVTRPSSGIQALDISASWTRDYTGHEDGDLIHVGSGAAPTGTWTLSSGPTVIKGQGTINGANIILGDAADVIGNPYFNAPAADSELTVTGALALGGGNNIVRAASLGSVSADSGNDTIMIMAGATSNLSSVNLGTGTNRLYVGGKRNFAEATDGTITLSLHDGASGGTDDRIYICNEFLGLGAADGQCFTDSTNGDYGYSVVLDSEGSASTWEEIHIQNQASSVRSEATVKGSVTLKAAILGGPFTFKADGSAGDTLTIDGGHAITAYTAGSPATGALFELDFTASATAGSSSIDSVVFTASSTGTAVTPTFEIKNVNSAIVGDGAVTVTFAKVASGQVTTIAGVSLVGVNTGSGTDPDYITVGTQRWKIGADATTDPNFTLYTLTSGETETVELTITGATPDQSPIQSTEAEITQDWDNDYTSTGNFVDQITINAGLTASGTFTLGGGNDSIKRATGAGADSTFSGVVLMGGGNDVIGGGTAADGESMLTMTGGVDLGDGMNIMRVSSVGRTGLSLNAITGGANADTVEVSGGVTGNVDLKGGANSLTAAFLTGSYTGGDDGDTIILTPASSFAPGTLNLGGGTNMMFVIGSDGGEAFRTTLDLGAGPAASADSDTLYICSEGAQTDLPGCAEDAAAENYAFSVALNASGANGNTWETVSVSNEPGAARSLLQVGTDISFGAAKLNRLTVESNGAAGDVITFGGQIAAQAYDASAGSGTLFQLDVNPSASGLPEGADVLVFTAGATTISDTANPAEMAAVQIVAAAGVSVVTGVVTIARIHDGSSIKGITLLGADTTGNDPVITLNSQPWTLGSSRDSTTSVTTWTLTAGTVPFRPVTVMSQDESITRGATDTSGFSATFDSAVTNWSGTITVPANDEYKDIVTLSAGMAASGAWNLGGGNNEIRRVAGAGDDATISGEVTLGAGADMIGGATASDNESMLAMSGGVTLGDGANEMRVSSAGRAGLSRDAITGGIHADTIEVSGAVMGNVDLKAGENSFMAESLSGNYTGGVDADTVTVNGAVMGRVNLGGGRNSLTAQSLSAGYEGGDAGDTIEISAAIGGNVDLGDGLNSLTAASLGGNYMGGSGNDTIRLQPASSFTTGTLNPGEGTNRLFVTGSVESVADKRATLDLGGGPSAGADSDTVWICSEGASASGCSTQATGNYTFNVAINASGASGVTWETIHIHNEDSAERSLLRVGTDISFETAKLNRLTVESNGAAGDVITFAGEIAVQAYDSSTGSGTLFELDVNPSASGSPEGADVLVFTAGATTISGTTSPADMAYVQIKAAAGVSAKDGVVTVARIHDSSSIDGIILLGTDTTGANPVITLNSQPWTFGSSRDSTTSVTAWTLTAGTAPLSVTWTDAVSAASGVFSQISGVTIPVQSSGANAEVSQGAATRRPPFLWTSFKSGSEEQTLSEKRKEKYDNSFQLFTAGFGFYDQDTGDRVVSNFISLTYGTVDSDSDLESTVTGVGYGARFAWSSGMHFNLSGALATSTSEKTARGITEEFKTKGQVFNMEIGKSSQISQTLDMTFSSGLTESWADDVTLKNGDSLTGFNKTTLDVGAKLSRDGASEGGADLFGAAKVAHDLSSKFNFKRSGENPVAIDAAKTWLHVSGGMAWESGNSRFYLEGSLDQSIAGADASRQSVTLGYDLRW